MKKYFIIFVLMLLLILSSCSQLPFSTGFATLSVDKTSFESNDPFVNGEAWLLNVVQNGDSQFATGSFNAEAVADEGRQATNDFTLTLDSSPQTCQYDMTATNNLVNGVQIIYTDEYTFSISTRPEDCFGNDGDLWVSKKNAGFTTKFTFYCVQYINEAQVGNIQFDKLAFETDVILKTSQETLSGTISNAGATSVTLGSGKAHASWVGNLVDGRDCPSPSDNDVRSAYTNDWIFIDDLEYQSYKSYDESGFRTCLTQALDEDRGTIQGCINNYNSLKSNALREVKFRAFGGESATTDGTTSNGKANIELSSAIQYPMITFRVRADILGIKVPVGEPKIVSDDCTDFSTGTKGFIEADVKNVGDDTATFSVYADCEAPIQMSGTNIKIQVEPDEVKTVFIPVTGQTNEGSEKSSCLIVAQDSENSNRVDTESTTCEVSKILSCVPDSERCNGEELQICSLDGTWNNVEGATECGDVTPPPEGLNTKLIVGIISLILLIAGIIVISATEGTWKVVGWILTVLAGSSLLLIGISLLSGWSIFFFILGLILLIVGIAIFKLNPVMAFLIAVVGLGLIIISVIVALGTFSALAFGGGFL